MSKLKKLGIFVKHLGKIKVNPIIVIDFKKNLNLVIRLVHNEETKKTILKGEINQEDVNQADSIRDSSKSSDNSPVQ